MARTLRTVAPSGIATRTLCRDFCSRLSRVSHPRPHSSYPALVVTNQGLLVVTNQGCISTLQRLGLPIRPQAWPSARESEVGQCVHTESQSTPSPAPKSECLNCSLRLRSWVSRSSLQMLWHRRFDKDMEPVFLRRGQSNLECSDEAGRGSLAWICTHASWASATVSDYLNYLQFSLLRQCLGAVQSKVAAPPC